MAKKMGRPLVFNEEKDRQLKELCRMKPTLQDAAAFLGVSESAIHRHLKSKYKMTFEEFRAKHMVFTRHMLVRTALKKAENGDNCMLIFCLKNLCHWQDKIEQTTDSNHTIKLNYKLDEE